MFLKVQLAFSVSITPTTSPCYVCNYTVSFTDPSMLLFDLVLILSSFSLILLPDYYISIMKIRAVDE